MVRQAHHPERSRRTDNQKIAQKLTFASFILRSTTENGGSPEGNGVPIKGIRELLGFSGKKSRLCVVKVLTYLFANGIITCSYLAKEGFLTFLPARRMAG
jgi:hypothetical protein